MIVSLFNDLRIRTLTIVCALFCLLVLLFNLFKIGGSEFVLNLNGAVLLPFALAGTLLSLLTWRLSHRRERTRTAWLALGVGLGLWTVAESIWTYYKTILKVDVPFPSVADYFYVAGNIPLIIALILRYRLLVTTPDRVQRYVVVGSYLAVLAIGFFFVVLPNFTTSSPDATLLEQILNVFYPVGDLAIMLGVVLVLLTLTGGLYSYPWMVIAVGFIFMTASDLLFSFGSMHDLYAPGGDLTPLTMLVDFPYFLAYVLIALGIYIHGRISRIY